MLFEPSQKGISDFLGAASITFWLFAQFPQVLENYRLGSCKGLALPFLVNWLLGDLTNLIGCIFTDQLPFQTYLATYFSLVDFILIVQFWYYGRKHKHRLRHAHHHHHPSHQASRQGSQYLYQSGTRSRTSHSRTRTYPSQPASMSASLTGNGSLPSRLASNKSEEGLPYTLADSQTLVHFREPHTAFPPDVASAHPSNDDINSDSEDAPPEMAESTLSQRSDVSSSTIGALARGRSIFRPSASSSAPDVRAGALEDGSGTNWRQLSGSRTRVTTAPRERPSQSRTRSVVFLSIWAFVGLGGLFKRTTLFHPLARSTSPEPVAWKVDAVKDELITSSIASAVGIGLLDDGLSPPPLDYSLLVGRVAAWMCVCFYLTSRMPQIWKNFRRQSVEGLSILLFAAAFMGNLFYVLSILSSPLVQEDEGYLFESVPFLLGSGGTLVFDLTIMGQACMYSGLPARSRDKLDHVHGEESSGLLARDSTSDLLHGSLERGGELARPGEHVRD